MKKVSKFALLGVCALVLMGFQNPTKAEIRVVTSIKPIHSLVSAVMDGVSSPSLLIEGAGSPHAYAMRPSQARNLQEADVIVWVGPGLEAFLVKPIATTGKSALSVPLIGSDGLIKLAYRGEHDHHDHGEQAKKSHDHDEDKHAKHEHDEHKHEHDEDKHAKHEHDAEKDEHHDHSGNIDPHVWLDPVNAKTMVTTIAEALSKVDPGNAARYRENAASTHVRLDQLVAKLRVEMKPLANKKYIVFHDAYQYFEERFGIQSSGAITLNPEVLPGAEHVRHIKEKVTEIGAVCVFSEPQFKPKLVSLVIEGTNAKSAVIDPLGSSITAGPDQYFQLITNMMSSMRDCLS